MLGTLVLLVASVTGEWRSRSRATRLEQLEARLATIDREACRTEPGSGAARAERRLEALRGALSAAAASAGAERAVLWDADPALRRITARMASDGIVTRGWLPFAGTPLGWLAEEGQALRFDARPPVTARVGTVVAARLGEPAHPSLLALEFRPSEAPAPERIAPVVETVQAALDAVAEQVTQVAYQERIAILLDALRRIPGTIDPASFSRELVRDAARLTKARGGAVALWTEDHGTIVGVDGDLGGPEPGALFSPGTSELALAARAGAPMLQDLSVKSVGPALVAADGERWTVRPSHLATIPLPVANETLGVLAVWSTDPLDPHGAELLKSLAPFAGSQLARALEFGRVRDSAERDALTGLPNRRAFDRVFEQERLRLERYEHPLALLIADVDHFKRVNDTWGHEAGDAVLRGVADILRTTLRDVDTVARFGGEEFIVLMPETALDAGVDAAERLRSAVEAHAFAWSGDPVPVRISVGVSACPECVPGPNDLLRSADAALYDAKGGGRNRVVAAPRAETPGLRRRWERRSP